MNAVSASGVIFGWVLRSSWQAAVLAGLILLAQWALRKRLSAGWRYGLWLLLLARLLMPAWPHSAMSVFNLTGQAARLALGVEAAFSGGPGSAAAAIPTVNREDRLAGRQLPPGPVKPAIEPTAGREAHSTGIVGKMGLEGGFVGNPAPPLGKSLNAAAGARMDWFGAAFYLWLAGVVALAGRLIWRNARFRSRIGEYEGIADGEVLRVFDECKAALGVSRRVRLIECEEVESPAVYGFWRVWLLLPDGILDRFSMGELRCVFAHELAHVKRGDLMVNWVVAGLEILHWFNPVLWLAWRRMRADRELAADALALPHTGASDAASYGETILKVLEGLTSGRAMPGMVGIVEDKEELKERMAAIGRQGKHWKWAAVVAAGIIAVLGLTSAQSRGSVSAKEDKRIHQRRVVTDGQSMKVTLLDAETGRPVAGAEVLAPDQASFWGGGADTAPQWITDTNGVATIRLGSIDKSHLKVMTWFTLSVRHAGYAPRGLSWSAQNADVRPEMPGEMTVRLERGVKAGGVVVDEKGAPVEGVHVELRGTEYWAGFKKEYSEFWSDSGAGTPAITDREGRWAVNDFPKDLEYIVITASWPQGSGKNFTASPSSDGVGSFNHQNPGEPFDPGELRRNKLALTLPRGETVRGIVVDPAGHSLPGVPVTAGFGAIGAVRMADTRTDGEGRFEFHHVLGHELIATARPDGFAMASMTVNVKTNAAQARLQVGPLEPLRVRVEDGEGKAVAGATIGVDNYHTEGQMLNFSGKTGNDGVMVWTNAPASAFALTAASPDGKVDQEIRVAPGEHLITFQLRSGMNSALRVTGRAHDAATGAAVALESIQFETHDDKAFKGADEEAGSGRRLTVAATEFRAGGFVPEYRLEARAKGYATYVSEWRAFREGDWEPDFALDPAHRPGWVVLLPDGAPAAGARVWSQFGPMASLYMNNNRFQEKFSSSGVMETKAGEDGSFEMPSGGDDATVIFSHDKGFLVTTAGEIRRHPTARLERYGSVAGVLKIDGKPTPNVAIGLGKLIMAPSTYMLSYFTNTAEDGSFSFSTVPAGEYQLSRNDSRGRTGPISEEYQMPVVVSAGETAKVDYSSKGRQVVGQAVAEDPDVEVDWLNDDHTLSLKPAEAAPVDRSDYATEKEWQEAIFKANAEARRAKRTYVLKFAPDGTFHAEDVPPGTYNLSIRVTKPESPRERWRFFNDPTNELGKLEREVVIAQGDGLVDLGKLVVKVRANGETTKRLAGAFEGRRLDGERVRLEDYRGKYLVLTFWAAWSDHCADELAKLETLREEFGGKDKVAWLDVGVDGDAVRTREMARERGFHITQATVEATNLPSVAAEFQVASLPATELVDPSGRIAGWNLDISALRAVLKRELQTQSNKRNVQ